MKKILVTFLAVLLVTFAASARADDFSFTIATPPPPIREEVITTAPGPDSDWVWKKGHWRYVKQEEEHGWFPGHWVRRPHRGAVWIEPRWEQHSSGWVFVEGRWK